MSAFFLCDKIEKQDKIEKSGASDESDTPPAKGEDKYSQLIICAVRHSLEGGNPTICPRKILRVFRFVYRNNYSIGRFAAIYT